MTQTCICGSDHDVSELVFHHSLIFSDLRVSGSSSSGHVITNKANEAYSHSLCVVSCTSMNRNIIL